MKWTVLGLGGQHNKMRRMEVRIWGRGKEKRTGNKGSNVSLHLHSMVRLLRRHKQPSFSLGSPLTKALVPNNVSSEIHFSAGLNWNLFINTKDLQKPAARKWGIWTLDSWWGWSSYIFTVLLETSHDSLKQPKTNNTRTTKKPYFTQYASSTSTRMKILFADNAWSRLA